MNFKHILVTTDFSPLSKKAFDYAAYQAKMEGSKVTLINVLEPFHVPVELQHAIWSPDQLNSMKEQYEKGARAQLEGLAKECFHDQKVETVLVTDEQSTAAGICDYAENNKCDLIVIVGHGRGKLGRFLLGSTVQKVLSDAPCPVLVIRDSAC